MQVVEFEHEQCKQPFRNEQFSDNAPTFKFIAINDECSETKKKYKKTVLNDVFNVHERKTISFHWQPLIFRLFCLFLRILYVGYFYFLLNALLLLEKPV